MNQKEYAALLDNTELPPEARSVYLCFRRYMDIATGITGIKRVVDYNEISQSLEYTPPRGSRDKSKRYSRDQIKRLIQLLVKRGFLEPLHAKGIPGQKMIFRLPLATTDSIRLNEERHLSATEGAPQVKPDSTGVRGDMSARGAPQEERHISDISDISTTTYARDDKFSMHDHWQFDPNRVSRLLQISRIDPSTPEVQRCLGPFISHYTGQPGRQGSQAQWESQLVKWVVREMSMQNQNLSQREKRRSVTAAIMDVGNLDY